MREREKGAILKKKKFFFSASSIPSSYSFFSFPSLALSLATSQTSASLSFLSRGTSPLNAYPSRGRAIAWRFVGGLNQKAAEKHRSRSKKGRRKKRRPFDVAFPSLSLSRTQTLFPSRIPQNDHRGLKRAFESIA